MLEAAAWRRQQVEAACLATGWYAANFVGASKAGKLKNLSEYLPDDEDKRPDVVELEPEQEELVWGLLLGPSAGTPRVN